MTSATPAEFGPEGSAYEQLDPGNAAHAPGRTCELCGAAITARQDARLLPDGRWIHEACPLAADDLPIMP